MSFFEIARQPVPDARRRVLLRSSGLTLSLAALALVTGCKAQAAARRSSAEATATDVGILNRALAAEFEAVAAYGVGAQSGLLQKPVLDLAVQFQGHHRAHADLLAATVKQLDGTPVEQNAQYSFATESLKTQTDVLRFAAQLEQGAVSAYLNAVPALDNRDLARAAASILGDEAMHWAVLRNALGENPVPAAFVG